MQSSNHFFFFNYNFLKYIFSCFYTFLFTFIDSLSTKVDFEQPGARAHGRKNAYALPAPEFSSEFSKTFASFCFLE